MAVLQPRKLPTARESIMLNEMSFKWEQGGVGVSPIVLPLWDWHFHDLVIKNIWTCYVEVII